MTVKNWFWCLPLSLMSLLSWAQGGLTLEQIMQDPTWMGEVPTQVQIAPDGKKVYFTVAQAFPLPPLWKQMELSSGKVRELQSSDRAAAFAGERFHKDQLRIDEVEGGLWLAQGNGPAQPLLVHQEPATFVRFLPGQRFVYREHNQLYVYDLDKGTSLLLSDVLLEEKKEPSPSYLAAEERKLLGAVENSYRLEAYNKSHEAEKREFGGFTKPKSAYLGKGFTLADPVGDNRASMDISDDLKHLAAILTPEGADNGTLFGQFVNKEATLKALEARSRVSVATATDKLVFVTVATGDVTVADLSDLPEIKTDRLAAVKSEQAKGDDAFFPKLADPPEPRPVQIVSGGFRGNQYLATVISHDWKDLWMVLFDATTGKKKVVFHHYDPAWVLFDTQGLDAAKALSAKASWSQDGQSVFYLSDKTGYQHLYRYNLKSGKTEALTSGSFEIHHPFEGPKGDYWYFHANDRHPGEYHFYRMPLKGGKWEALTTDEGYHQVTLSEDGQSMVDLFAETNRPPRLRVRTLTTAWKELYDGRSEAFKAIAWQVPEIVAYQNRDGKNVYARLYKPAKANGAGVVFSHGAGYLQNAHKGWSGYFREYMFHNLLASQGYTVLDPDYQASAGYGRDWRTAIYRHMGGKDLTDILDGASFLVAKQGVDAKRVGTYGGSYGGFLTLMALFTSPDTFKSGAALRSVTDWAHYNHWYTSRILNTPEIDPLAYRRSSPMYFAEGLKGHLLMCHGMVDDNVQYIDIVRLSQKLIELGKKDWSLASFPVEPHGFTTASGWTDEYRRIKELFDRTLLP